MNRTKKVSRKYAEMFNRPDHLRRMGLAEEKELDARARNRKGRLPVTSPPKPNPVIQAAQRKAQAKQELEKMPKFKRLLTRKGRQLRHQAR